LPPPSAVCIRVLQGKRFRQCNVAAIFLQILFNWIPCVRYSKTEPLFVV
jgi:hypothetical protein